jgi:hypothetical protein
MTLKVALQLFVVAALLLTSCLLPAQSSDTLILVVPQGSQISISATCTGVFSQEEIQKDFSNLASRLQGRVLGLESREMETTTQGNLPSAGRVITFTATLSAPGLVREGAVDLPAFVRAFQRFQQMEVLFFVPPINGFRGLRSFENDAVSVQLLEEPSANSQTLQPYRYRVQLKDQSSPVELPLTEPPTVAEGSPVQPEHTRPSSQTVFFLRLVLIAVCAGLAVLVIGLLFVRRR